MLFKFTRILIIATALFAAKQSVAQIDSVGRALERIALQQSSSVLFVHFDKNIYTNNDQVWFTGYLLKSTVEADRHRTLYLSLVYLPDSSVVLQQKFLIDKGFTYGNLTLPDSLQSGNYRFIANTNIRVGGKPDVEFIQPISIKSTTIDPLKLSAEVFESRNEKTGIGRLLLKAMSSDSRFVSDASVNYSFGKQKTFKSGKAKTSVIGEVMLDFPADTLNASNNLFTAVAKKNNTVRHLKFDLPVAADSGYVVRFYPEGGHLVAGIQSNVGLEIRDKKGNPIQTSGILFENNRPIDTLYTSASGMGMFALQPGSDKQYRVQLLQKGQLPIQFPLPESIKSGLAMSIGSAIAQNDLRGVLESTTTNQVHLLVHNYKQVFLHSVLQLKAKNAQRFLLKLDSLPIGLATITILDSLYRPMAERLFFAHHDQIPTLNIDADQVNYQTRSPVNLKLSIADHQDQLIKGIVSISCVQANRISIVNQSNIVDYAYLNQELEQLPIHLSGGAYQDRTYLEDVLRIKGWRKYTWPTADELQREIPSVSEYIYSGSVTRSDKKLKSKVSLNALSMGNIQLVQTDPEGGFTLNDQILLSEDKNRVILNLNERNYLMYKINLNDPFEELKKHIHTLNFDETPNQMKVVQDLSNTNAFTGIKLKEVTIRKTNTDSFRYGFGSGPNKCGDYVCSYNILNCPNHLGNPGNKTPIEGKSYYDGRMSNTVIYHGCRENKTTANMVLLNPISLPKEFYVSDISNLNEPINFPTVYWNYEYLIDGQHNAPLTFNTGDLTGNFKIIIQGLSEKGPVYAEKEIRIEKKDP